MPLSLPFSTAGRALAVALALSSAGATAHAAPHRAHKPPKHQTASSAKSSRSKSSKSKRAKSSASSKSSKSRTASRPAADSALDLPTLPPSVLQINFADLAMTGGMTASEAFALVPTASPTTPSKSADASTSNIERPFSSFSASAERLLSAVIERARSQLGTRYVFGGNKPGEGLDCSSFARFAMEALGVKLPRTAAQQARMGAAVPRDRAMLRPGDLLTFGRGSKVSHVGIYLGEGRFIHASVTSGQIIETTIERNKRLFKRWQGARRIIAGEPTPVHGDG